MGKDCICIVKFYIFHFRCALEEKEEERELRNIRLHNPRCQTNLTIVWLLLFVRIPFPSGMRQLVLIMVSTRIGVELNLIRIPIFLLGNGYSIVQGFIDLMITLKWIYAISFLNKSDVLHRWNNIFWALFSITPTEKVFKKWSWLTVWKLQAGKKNPRCL